MTVAAILRNKGNTVFSVAPMVTVAELVKVLADHRIGAVPVVDASGRLLGIVSERNVVRSLAANGPQTLEMMAGQLMTRALYTVTRATTVAEAMTLMTTRRIRHLPVVEQDDLIGIVSIGDVVKAQIMNQPHEVENLRVYVAGAA